MLCDLGLESVPVSLLLSCLPVRFYQWQTVEGAPKPSNKEGLSSCLVMVPTCRLSCSWQQHLNSICMFQRLAEPVFCPPSAIEASPVWTSHLSGLGSSSTASQSHRVLPLYSQTPAPAMPHCFLMGQFLGSMGPSSKCLNFKTLICSLCPLRVSSCCMMQQPFWNLKSPLFTVLTVNNFTPS